jgi:peptidoglycan/xylan/chitin deacetylase (PgdA/CDA1 family)
VAITIDDGYADALYQAKPLLERYEIPATTFVATGYLGREFWWDKLERIIFSPEVLPNSLSLPVNDHIINWTSVCLHSSRGEKEDPSSRRSLLQVLYNGLLPLNTLQRQQALAELEAWAGIKSGSKPYCRALTSDELIELASGDLVDIGAHTVTHPVLTRFPAEVQRVEIEQSKLSLERILNRPVHSFSYPHGSASEETSTIVRNYGFLCACTSDTDVVSTGGDPFNLPRFWIPDWDISSFVSWLKWWLVD